MERLNRVVEAGGRLLKAERVGGAGPGIAPAFLLTFDVGRLLIEVDSVAGRVHSVHIESAEEIPKDLELASEDEPWWRIMGCPLARVSAGDVGAQGLRLQFREDHDNPRIVALIPSGADVQVRLEPLAELH
ncbi:MAG: hypothetical protein QF570_09320 [Myxococcota bacterium]|jgi:hypothetical protein|nr:hypothetical protein [Myxococcota bacterium]